MTLRRYRRLLAYGRRYRFLFTVSLAGAVIASTLDGFTFALLIPFLRSLFGGAGAVASPTRVELLVTWVLHKVFDVMLAL